MTDPGVTPDPQQPADEPDLQRPDDQVDSADVVADEDEAPPQPIL